MRVVRVRGLNEYTDRHGKRRRYHRASGTPIDPTLTDQALALEVARLDALHKPQAAKAGTLGGLLESYKQSPRFMDLKDRTKSDYRKIMDYLRPISGTPLVEIGPGFIAKLRDKAQRAKKTGFTNHMLAMLAAAFHHAVEYELVERNPVAGIAKAKMPDDRKRPNRAWTPDERKNVVAAAPAKLRLPLLLARSLGLRLGDIVRLPRSAYRSGWLDFRASKNNKLLRLPVVGAIRAEIEAAIAAAPTGDSLLLCLNTRGKPWTAGGLEVEVQKFLKQCRERGIMGPKGSLHGLRHSAGAELRGAGYDKEQRKLILGHYDDDMAEHYSASADVTGQLIEMANVLEGRPKRERVLHNRGKSRA